MSYILRTLRRGREVLRDHWEEAMVFVISAFALAFAGAHLANLQHHSLQVVIIERLDVIQAGILGNRLAIAQAVRDSALRTTAQNQRLDRIERNLRLIESRSEQRRQRLQELERQFREQRRN